MTTISLLTPLDPARAIWLDELAVDIRALRSSVSAAVEWVVCIDGPDAVGLPGDVSSAVRLAIPGGPAAARTAALAASVGDWSLPLDADDRLDVAGTARIVTELDALEETGIGWVGASRTLLDGTPTVHTLAGRRRWTPGMLADQWTAPFPFHPNSVVVKRALGLACGGWPALPSNEDLAFMLAVSEVASGVTVDDVITRYRIWDGQTVNDAAYVQSKEVAFATIAALHSARRVQAGRSRITPPSSPGGALGRVAR